MKQVIAAGGKVLGEPMEIPGVGQYVSIIDTEGNRISMLQPIPMSWHAQKKRTPTKTAVKKKTLKRKALKKK